MNTYLAKLSIGKQTLLRASVFGASEELIVWFRMIYEYAEGKKDQSTEGDPWWCKIKVVLHLLFVIRDLVDAAKNELDSAALPDNWPDVFDYLGPKPVFQLTSESRDRFAEVRWSYLVGNDLDEKKRALCDVQDAIEELWGRAFPCLFGDWVVSAPSRDDSAIFETWSELDHVISHFERDFLADDESDDQVSQLE